MWSWLQLSMEQLKDQVLTQLFAGAPLLCPSTACRHPSRSPVASQGSPAPYSALLQIGVSSAVVHLRSIAAFLHKNAQARCLEGGKPDRNPVMVVQGTRPQAPPSQRCCRSCRRARPSWRSCARSRRASCSASAPRSPVSARPSSFFVSLLSVFGLCCEHLSTPVKAVHTQALLWHVHQPSI